jgi:hypothetical protein
MRSQLGMDARAAIRAATALVRFANQHAESPVLDGTT